MIDTDDEFAKKWGELGPVYGKQWRAFGGYNKVPSGWNHGAITHYKEVPKCDQLENLINDLKTNPDSRRLIVTAWNPCELDQMTLPPCHYGFQVYTRELTYEERIKLFEEKTNRSMTYTLSVRETLDSSKIPTRAISLMWNQRSVDTFLGLPFNIASYGLLLEIIAKEVNMVPDELIGNLGDVHLYSNHIEQAKEQIGRELSIMDRIDLASKKYDNFDIMDFGIPFTCTHEDIDEMYPVERRTREPYPLPKLVICGDMRRTDSFTVPFDELEYHLIKLIDYQSHPTIKAPLSN
jgi:thymidylate synthase